ncbi:CsbD family protein [Mycobacterium yunnanensis]|uniref:CsbD family protein n=1 Tax=Mycobacterium yunnanensis TaxID=368477 RepID=A0A9X2YZG3_9MYCO|nr:CsbD family protein [Mycobacterium yunnanensis]MCV7420346.1 CsbD family protein [Mycobacterium yunnanensis]
MSEHDMSDEARKGLIDSVKGKAKEIAGAMTGNDSLTAEGQLEQTQARERKEANSVQAVADAEAEQARELATEARLEGAQERIAVDARTASVESSIVTEQAAQKADAERTAQQEAQRAAAEAEAQAEREVQRAEAQERVDVRAAASEATEAVDEHQAAVENAEATRAAAEAARERADRLTDNADLP